MANRKNGNAPFYIGVASLLLLGGIAYFTRGRTLSYLETVWDPSTEKQLQKLDPIIRDRARRMILEAQSKGINLRIPAELGGCRTWAQQDALYSQGRTAPGPIVTNAKGGQSYHNYCLAFDVVEIDDFGQPIWENPKENIITALGKSYGFEWGGPGDPGHFYTLEKGTWQNLLAAYNAGQIDNNGYIIV